jgi:hypothetical protein
MEEFVMHVWADTTLLHQEYVLLPTSFARQSTSKTDYASAATVVILCRAHQLLERNVFDLCVNSLFM